MSGLRWPSLALMVLAGLLVSVPPARAAETDEVKKEIATQFELLKAGKADELKKHFTARLQDSITADAVKQGQQKVGSKITLDELVATVEIGQDGSKKVAKIKMKNGRSLTTLILTNGQWLADTVWFK
jgi:RecG-like helicase